MKIKIQGNFKNAHHAREVSVDYTYAKFQKYLYFDAFILLNSDKRFEVILTCNFGSFVHRRRKLTKYLESVANSQSETCAYYAKNIDLKIRPHLTRH